MADGTAAERALMYGAFVAALSHVPHYEQLTLLSDPCRNLLASVLDQVPAFITVSRLDGTVIACNQATLQLIGLPRDQVVGSNAHDWYECTEYRADMLDRLRTDDGPQRTECNMRRPDGGTVRVLFWTLLFHEQGLILAIGQRVPSREWRAQYQMPDRVRIVGE